MVGLLPLAAVAIFEEDMLEKLPGFCETGAKNFMARHPELAANIHMPATPGVAGRRMLSIVNEDKLRRILARMLDENEFFGPHGIRALSRYHRDHPFVFNHGRPRVQCFISSGRLGQRHVRRQFELARSGMDAGKLPALHSPSCDWAHTTAIPSR